MAKITEIITIGDLHGKDVWKQIDPKKFDRIIFLGDYVDSCDRTNAEMAINLMEIIEFKKANPDKVILLLGNHDIQYLLWPLHRCSGYSSEGRCVFHPLFVQNRELFQIAYQIENVLFTHAGVSKKWLELAKEDIEWTKQFDPVDLADSLNMIHNSCRSGILHMVSFKRGGSDPCGGLTWADISELKADDLPEGYVQYVGHNIVRDFITRGKSDTKITFCDVLDTKTEFFEVTSEFQLPAKRIPDFQLYINQCEVFLSALCEKHGGWGVTSELCGTCTGLSTEEIWDRYQKKEKKND